MEQAGQEGSASHKDYKRQTACKDLRVGGLVTHSGVTEFIVWVNT